MAVVAGIKEKVHLPIYDSIHTFRFAEPIYIDKQQNFRVELEIPDADTLKEIQQIYGPLFIWVVLDGYMTRDVQ